MPPASKGTHNFTAPTLVKRMMVRAILRGAGGSRGHAIALAPANEYRTTKCCSRCGAETVAPWVTQQRVRSKRLRECPACKERHEQQQQQQQQQLLLQHHHTHHQQAESSASTSGGQGRVAPAGAEGGEHQQGAVEREGGPVMEGEGEGRRDHAAGLRARRADVKKQQQAYQLHRDVNAAWNLVEVGAAMYAGLPRPAYLMPAHTAAQPPGQHCAALKRTCS